MTTPSNHTPAETKTINAAFFRVLNIISTQDAEAIEHETRSRARLLSPSQPALTRRTTARAHNVEAFRVGYMEAPHLHTLAGKDRDLWPAYVAGAAVRAAETSTHKQRVTGEDLALFEAAGDAQRSKTTRAMRAA